MGQRGLKQMLGGNELIFKKEKNKLEEELVREDWMNKPLEEMNDDEKQRLKEFEQRVADSREKQQAPERNQPVAAQPVPEPIVRNMKKASQSQPRAEV